MKIRRIGIGVLLLWAATGVGAPSDIKLSGTMQSQNECLALINGDVYHVNEEVAGGRITAIDEKGITVLFDGKPTVYLVEDARPSETRTVQKSKSKPKSSKNWFERMKEKLSQDAPKKKVQKKPKSKEASVSANAADQALARKMRMADQILADRTRYLDKSLKQCKTYPDLERVVARFNKLQYETNARLNNLRFPDPSSCPNNTAYRQWIPRYQQRVRALVGQEKVEIEQAAKRVSGKVMWQSK